MSPKAFIQKLSPLLQDYTGMVTTMTLSEKHHSAL